LDSLEVDSKPRLRRIRWSFETTSNDLGGYEHLQHVRMLTAFYEKPGVGVKPNYSRFSERSIKVINNIYLIELIQNILLPNRILLKLTV
jgi:hypothetical protein